MLVLHTTVGLGGSRLNDLFNNGVYNVLMFGAGLAVLARAITIKAQRPAWLMMAAGVLCWSVGELYFTLFVEGRGAASGSVSPADAFYVAFYLCVYAALMLLLGAHLRELRISIWLDGLIGGLGAATLAAAVILPPIIDSAHGDVGSVAVALAYPIADLLLLIFTIGALGITGWRPGRVWLLIAASMLLTAIADSTYLYQTATHSYRADTWVEGLWPAAAILLAIAAWTLGVLVLGNVPTVQLTPVAVILATATVLAVCARLMFTVRENLAMLVGSRRLALTDPLTGLGNRRQLMEDLKLACSLGRANESWQLVLYDLNGFKRYNDTYGHPAGDALLARLSDKLRAIVAAHGTAYRMGGDEFCVLAQVSISEREQLIHSGALRARAGLLDRRRARRGEHPGRGQRLGRGSAAGRPAAVRAQGPDTRRQRGAAAARRAAAGIPRALSRPPGAPARGGRACARRWTAAGPGRGRARRARPRG